MYQYQVSFDQAVKMAFQRYFTIDGRSSRSEYWWFALFNVILSAICAVIGNDWLSSIVNLALVIPGITLGVRRLHDIGKSGWFMFLALIPLVGQIILIVWFCRQSDMYDNMYGPVPNVTIA